MLLLKDIRTTPVLEIQDTYVVFKYPVSRFSLEHMRRYYVVRYHPGLEQYLAYSVEKQRRILFYDDIG